MLRNAFRLVNLLLDIGVGIFTLMSLDNAYRGKQRAIDLFRSAARESWPAVRADKTRQAEMELRWANDSRALFLISSGSILAHRLTIRVWRRLRA